MRNFSKAFMIWALPSLPRFRGALFLYFFEIRE
jgi:hypothetical protein